MPNLNLKDMQKLASSKHSCIVKKEQKIQLLIQPCYATCLKKGIKVTMDKLTIGFCKQLGGLILGYENVRVLPWSGCIHSTSPFIHLHVNAVFYVFAPTKGLLIEGIVNKVTPHMVSFLAYNKYNIIYRVHQVRQELKQQALRSSNPRTAKSAKLVLQHLKKLNLSEGICCTLLLQEVALRDFLPSLLGYPVPEGLDVSCMDDVSLSSPVVNSTKKRVRFSDQESVCSIDTPSSESPSLTPGVIKEEVAPADLNGSLVESSDSEVSTEPAPSKTKDIKKEARSDVESTSEEETVTDNAVKEEVISPHRPLCADASLVKSTLMGMEFVKPKKQKKKNKKRDGNDEALASRAELIKVIESGKLCYAADFSSSINDLTNGGLELQSSVKKSSKRKRDENSEGEFLQNISKKARKK
ncbi:hypothetical protein FHG87_010779 [Trinorchestia longiramus]|nr:hypothetical protein FHG87_010779 [Trinorchestia longiramus]